MASDSSSLPPKFRRLKVGVFTEDGETICLGPVDVHSTGSDTKDATSALQEVVFCLAILGMWPVTLEEDGK